MSAPPPPPPAPVTLRHAFWYWLKLGFISFGGPAGQIALMHAELVERRRWISEQRFLHALNYCMVLPGPEATQLAIYIGWLLHRVRGGVLAGVLFVLPSLVILAALSWTYLVFGSTPVVAGVLYGVKPAVVAIVLAAAWRIGTRALRHPALVAIAVLAFAGLAFLNVPFPAIVLGAALLGTVGARARPAWFATARAAADHASGASSVHPPALIDDDTPTPAHGRFSWPRLAASVGAGLGLWAASWAALAASTGAHGPLATMSWFFTKAALLTFGGAYAVLPYIYHGAVTRFHWATADQMVDGLALGETTPGPLIMIVAFIGFVGGWGQQAGGTPLAGGVAGAVVATWFTFLPSFIFILAGGPLVESTRGNIHLTAPLTAISAAVVGVIASLALQLGRHVLVVPSPWPALICAAAAIALLRWRVGTIGLIAACAGAGLVLSYWHG